MTKDKTITFRLSPHEAKQLKQITFSQFDSSVSETLRRMIGQEYNALLKAGHIK